MGPLDVAEKPPEPLLKGRCILTLGVVPGLEADRISRLVYER